MDTPPARIVWHVQNLNPRGDLSKLGGRAVAGRVVNGDHSQLHGPGPDKP
jgi:hypothetical protein